MADESVAKGGLIYEINVRGDFEKVIQTFENKIAELEARAKTLGKTIGSSTSASAKTSTKTKEVEALSREEAIKRKLVQLENKINVAGSRRVADLRVIAGLEQRIQDLKVKQGVISDELLDSDVKLSRAKTQNIAAQQKLNDVSNRVARARVEIEREGQRVTLEAVKAKTGLTEKQILANDRELATLKEREIAAQREEKRLQKQLAQQEAINARQAEFVAMQQKVRDYAAQHNVSEYSAARALNLSAQEAKKLGFEISHAQQFAENFFFTFRRLVGILAIFTLARKFAQYIGAGVREMTRFNGVLEQTQIGFTSILASVSDIVDSNGKLLEGIDKYHAATRLSAEMMKQVRIEALFTVATFEELVNAVEAGIAPGIQAGVTDMKELIKLISLISKAASTQGIKGSQFAEEIRAALTGQGSIRTTRLFQAGILDPAQIKQAREQGKLIEYLTDKLGPFATASDEVTKSWAGLTSNFKDAVQILLASGGVEYFDTLKESLQSFINVLVNKQDLLSGGLGLNRDAVAGIEEVGSSLADFVKEFQQITSAEETVTSLRVNLMAVGEVFRTIGKLIVPLAVGLIRIGAIVSTIVGGIFKIVNGILSWIGNLPGIGTALKQIYSLVGSILGALVIWAVFQKAIAAGLVVIEFLTGGISVLQAAWATTAAIIRGTQIGIANGLKVITALVYAIQAAMSIWALVAAAIAAIIGLILYRTGLISKGFDKLNKTLGISKGNLKDSAENIKNMIFGISSASTESKKLEESFAGLEDKIDELAIKVKAMVLVAGIQGEAKEIFDTYAESYEELAKDIRKNKEEEEKLNKEIAEKQAKYSDEERKRAKELNQEKVAGQRVGQRGGLQQRTDPLSFYDPSKSDRINVRVIEDEKIKLAIIEAQQKTLAEIGQNESEIKALEIQRKEIQDIIAKRTEYQTQQLTKQLRLNEINLDNTDGWLGGVKDINRQYELQAAIASEMLFNASALTKELVQQTLEVKKQKDLYEREKTIREDANSKALNLLKAMQEEFAISDDGLTQLFFQLRMSDSGFSVPIILDIVNGKDVSRDVVKQLQEDLSKIDLTEETQKILDNIFSLATAQAAYNAEVTESDQKLKMLVAKYQEQLKVLERLAKLTADQGFFDSITNGFSVGIQDFVDASQTAAEGFANAISSALENAVSRSADALTDLLDPRVEEKATAGEVTGEVLLGLANSIINTLLQQFAVSILTNLGLAQAPQIAALSVNTAAITTLTGAIATLIGTATGQTAAEVANTIATTSDTVATTVNTGATTANTGGLLSNLGALVTNTAATLWHGVVLAAQTALWVAQMIANVAATIALTIATWASAISPFNKGGLVGRGYNKGGKILKENPYLFGTIPGYTNVVGYASGGNISAHPRPRNIHPKDTVPAWLTPGEYVVREPAVRFFGVDFLSKINAMRITPDMGEKILAAKIKSHRGVYGFAGGGSVPRPSTIVSGGSESNMQILPVLVTDNNNMDQMLAGGRKPFRRNVNEVVGKDNPNASETWR